MKHSRLYVVYSTGLFVLLSIVLFIISSRLIAYFQTPEDLSLTTTSENPDITEFYQPAFNWQPHTNEGREMEKHMLKKISNDYFASYYYHNLYLSRGQEVGIHDFYTKVSREKVQFINASLHELNQTIHHTTISHDLKLELYAEDGTLVVLKDTQINYHQLYENEVFASGYYDSAQFDVMLLLEDNFWRVRHKTRSTIDLPKRKVKQDFLTNFISSKKNQFINSGKKWVSKGINYYPAEFPWEEFWPNLSADLLTSDFKLIHEAGFNTIRVFVPYLQFGGAEVKEDYLQKLGFLFEMADQQNLKVIVTLFDFFLGYSVDQWTLSDRHAEAIVTRFADHPAILSWDIKNEPDLDFEDHGKAEVKEWLNFMIKRIKTYDPKHLVTIGWSSPEYMEMLGESVDYYSFHYYKEADKLKNYLNQTYDKPVLLEETGQHSFNAWWYPFRKSDADQATYLKQVFETVDSAGISYNLWTLYDFKQIPDNVVGKALWRKGIQKNFGLIDKKGKPKPVFEVVKGFNNRPVRF
ncbi:MAG: cellulase family glycosylhydrolase [Bacteroidota bacterium]